MSTAGTKPKSGALDALLGQRIRLLRRERGMSQTALAERVGITFQQVQKYENGTNRVSAMTLVKLAAALGVSATTLLNGLRDADEPQEPLAEDDRLLNAFGRIPSAEVRAAVLLIVEALADGQGSSVIGALNLG